MKNAKRFLSLILVLAMMLSSGITLYAGGGGAGNGSYKVKFIKSADVPDNYADYLSYRDYSTGSSDPIAIKDGASIKAGTIINIERSGDVAFYIDGVEFQNGYKMPNHNLTVEVVADGHLEENVLLAKPGVTKPNAWNTVTINANGGSFDNGTGNVSSLTLYVNPLYEVELIKAGRTTSYSYLYTLRAPKGKIIKEGLKGTFTDPNTTFNITYDDLPNTTITLHNWDGSDVNPPLTKTRDTKFNDILIELRKNQKQPKEGYKFICWTKRKDMQNSLKSSTYRSKIDAGDFVWNQKYDDIIYYHYNVADGYNGNKDNVDLYECITPMNNTIVYKFLARKFKNGIGIDKVEYVNVLGDNSQTKYKEFLENNESNKKLYKITETNPLQYEEVTNLNEIINTDTALLELEGSQNEEPGESEKHRELLVVGEPKVKYTEDNTATLDLSHMVVELVDTNDKSKVTYVPFEEFGNNITTSPAHGDALDATFNSKSIKVMHGNNFTYTKLGLMVKKENKLYIPYYEVLNAKLNETSYGKEIEFLDETSTEHEKVEKNPIDYKVTLKSSVLDFSKKDCHFYENGFYTYKFTDEDAGKVYTLPVRVTYRDGTTDETNIVIKVDPKPNQEASDAPNVDEIKELSTEITGTGVKGAKIQVFKGDKPIGEAIVGQDNKWKITNIDANELKKDDSITVMQTEEGKKATSTDVTVIADTSKQDKDRYEAKSTKIVKEHGQAVTDAEVKNAVTVEGYPASATKPEVTIDAGQTLPDGQTAGTTKISVTVKYPDNSEDKLQVEVEVKEASQPTQTDAEKYEAKSTKIVKEHGQAVTDAEVKNAVTVEGYPANATKPEVTIDAGQTLPDGQTAGTTKISVTVKYPDNSEDKLQVEVEVKEASQPTQTDAEKYEAKSTKIVKEHGQAVTDAEVKNAVTVEGYPSSATKPEVTIDAGQTLPDGQTAGTTKISVTVKYPDNSEDKLQVEVEVKEASQPTQTDAEKYEAKSTKIVKEHGQAVTDAEVKNAVTVEGYPANATKPEVTIDAGQTLPDGQTAGTTKISVTVKYPDNSEDKLQVEVEVKEASQPTQTDAEKYEAKSTKIVKEHGQAVTDAEVKNAVTVEGYPANATKPEVTIDAGQTLPDGQTAGTTKISVTVKYPDNSEDKLQVEVEVKEASQPTQTDAEKYEAKSTKIVKEHGQAVTDAEVKNAVTVEGYPANATKPEVTIDAGQTLPDGQTAGTTKISVTVKYPDNSEDKLQVEVEVKEASQPTQTDAEKYEAKSTKIVKEHGQAVTDAEVKNAVTVEGYPSSATKPEVTIDAGQTLPDGQTAGTTKISVTVKYPDNSEDKLQVEVEVKEASQPTQTDAEKYEAKSTKIVKEHGQAVTDAEVKNAVTVEGYPASATKPEVTIDAGQTLPDGQTAGTTKISVTVKYPDNSEDKLQVEVEVKKASQPTGNLSIDPTYHGNVHANPSNPLPGDLVRLTAVPDNGFELDYFDVRDQFGNPVKVYGDYFYMPDGPVNVHAVFREIGSYHRPYYPDNYEYRYRRNRKDNNEEDTIVEEKPVKVYEAIALVTIGSKNLEKTVNGVHTVTLLDVAAQIKNGRTMIPLRYVAEALGFNVTWIKETRTVVIYDSQFKVEIPVDTNTIIVNGVKFESDVKPQIVNNRTLLPIANIARALGLKDGTDILWNPTTRQATIIRRVYSK